MWAQRDRLLAELPRIVGVGRILGGSSANFLLVQFLNKSAAEGEVPDNLVVMAVYEALAREKRVVLWFRGKEPGCLGCLRITVGTKEVDSFLGAIKSVSVEVCARLRSKGQQMKDAKREQEANDIVV